MTEAIHAALKKLDPNDDKQWTADGLPKLDAIGIQGITRQDVTKAAPHFSRQAPVIVTPAEVEENKAKEVAAKEAAAKSELEKALDVLKTKTDKINALEKERHDLMKRMVQAQMERDDAAREVSRLNGTRSSQHDIMDYLAHVQKENLLKAEALRRQKEVLIPAGAEAVKGA